jgi:hypothetical protein
MKKFLTEELIRFWFGLASTAIGVLIALQINSSVDHKRDNQTYNSMLIAINLEATQNKIILDQSFYPNYNSGIVRREFSTKVCDDFLTTKIFLEHAPSNIIGLLTEYTLNLKRANNFRIADEKYKYDKTLYDNWGKDLTSAFSKVLNNCDTLIQSVVLETK